MRKKYLLVNFLLLLFYLQGFILEKLSGKVELVKAGAYDDVDISLMVHPR